MKLHCQTHILGAHLHLCYNRRISVKWEMPLQRRIGFVAWLVILGAIATFFFAWQYFNFRQANRTLPAGMTMAGRSMDGMTREQALGALEGAFAMPMDVIYREQRLSLSPDTVELRYDAEVTAANLDEALSQREGFDGFIAHVLRRPLASIDVPVAVDYSEAQLNSFLIRVAGQYDQEPQEPIPLPASLTLHPGRPGYKLNIDASRARCAATIVSAVSQQVELVVQIEKAPAKDIDILNQLLYSLLSNYVGLTPGIFVKDLQTGDEVEINADVAYAGLGILKIAILEETYRVLNPPFDPVITDWVSDTVGVTSDNVKANLLLQDVIGNGDGYQGAENLTISMNHLGLVNTFAAAPYDEESSLTIVTSANSRVDITTNPDPYRQTTPLDVGMLLEMIYQCNYNGGTLMVAYPDSFTPDKCNQMIEWMSLNRADSFIETGVPVGTQVAHKQGFTGDTHADAAIVFSPGGDFVLVVYLYRSQWLEWEESAPLIANVATATYNYFNPTP
ncbi:MAG: class A beta-lactamase-related serine hydrolase [Chloroflexi bacterium]|nr:class A beta-lactamase-related serine hydrolase [Chloroflexota bacterium]